MNSKIPAENKKPKLRKYVLTGGTSVGKTTIIDLLAKLEHPTFPEFSRIIINRELKKEDGVLPWTKPDIFQDMYAKEQVREEMDIEKYLGNTREEKDYIFMDRCIVDGIAFCQHAGVVVPHEIDNHIQKLRKNGQDYNLIFILGPLETYHFDEGRILKPEESLSIQAMLEKAYVERGYKLIPVPFMTPQERVDFIFAKIKEYEENLSKPKSN
ncbi:MAG: ATP-binding protein [Candidatus Pacebacteria bacterium]|nr:ATP-binding protein [Candidatus Paceibacterota bacterium]